MIIQKILNILVELFINIVIKLVKYFDYITQVRVSKHSKYIDKLDTNYRNTRNKAIDKHSDCMLDLAKLRTNIEVKTKGIK